MNLKRQIFNLILDHHKHWNCIPTKSKIHQLFHGTGADIRAILHQLEHEGLIRLSLDGEISLSPMPAQIPAPRIKLRNDSDDDFTHQVAEFASGHIALDLGGVGISMPKNFLNALHVHDDLMCDAGIVHGDIALIIEGQPVTGDIVLVTVDRREVLRRYVHIKGIPHLIAENPQKPDLRAAFEVSTYGILWGLIRTEPCRRSVHDAHPKIRYSSAEAREDLAMSIKKAPLQRGNRIEKRVTAQIAVTGRRRNSQKSVGMKHQVSGQGKVILPKGWPAPPAGNRLNDNPNTEWPPP